MHNDGTSTMSLMNMQQKLKQKKIDNGSFAREVERLSKNSVFKATLRIYSKKEKNMKNGKKLRLSQSRLLKKTNKNWMKLL